MTRPGVAGAALLALLGTLASAAPEARVVRARYLMGTVFRFEAPAAGDPAPIGAALDAALDEVDRLEGILSNWRPESELSRLNRAAGEREVAVSEDLYAVVEAALHWAGATGGAFDPTVEPQTRRFRNGILPSDALPPRRGDWRGVLLDGRRKSVRFRSGVKGLDLGGIAKGYALDRAAALLRERGIPAALLDAGGQLMAIGAPPGEPGWRVGVADPSDRQRPALPLLLRDASAATSGNAERPGEIVDPEDGRSVAWLGSATAIHPAATAADALSTALFVLGPRRGLEWAPVEPDLFPLFLEPARSAGEAPVVRTNRRLPPPGRTWLAHSQTVDHRRALNVEDR